MAKLGRRDVMRSTLALGAIGALDAQGCSDEAPRPTEPLAQRYTIAARIPADGKYWFMHDPGITRTPSGRLLVAAPCWQLEGIGGKELAYQTFLSRSDDGGKTWEALPALADRSDATPFAHGGKTYMFVQSRQFDGLHLVRSDDDGQTWSAPVDLPLSPLHATDATKSYWNCSTPMLEDEGRLLWAVQSRGFDPDPASPTSTGGVVVIAADLAKDLMDPSAWTISSEAGHPIPATPPILERGIYPDARDWWLEPNIVRVNGKIRVLLRTILDGYATAGVVVVCELTGMELRFVQYAPMVGAQNKFFILTDPQTGLFWCLSNLAADPQEAVFDWKTIKGPHFRNGGGNDRRFLMLWYSVDALSWFPAGCVARTQNPYQSFMYPSALIDGEDIVLISRTSVNGGTQHDADLVTFHRIERFRDLAMDLTPRF